MKEQKKKQTNYRLVALDMDGTALNPDTELSVGTQEAICEALRAGTQIVFCSGRCTAEIRPFADRFPQMRYAICENGAYAVDLLSGEYVVYNGLDRRSSDRIMEETYRHDVLIQLASGGKYYMQDWTLERLSEFGLEKYSDLMAQTGVFVHDLPEFYRNSDLTVSKINFYCTSHEERAQIMDSLESAALPVTYVSGLADNIEMVSVHAGKGAGLSALCAALHIPREQVIAIGDNHNDLSMLRAAGLSVAMGNAVPEVKAAADELTEDNAHDGAAAAIRRLVLH